MDGVSRVEPRVAVIYYSATGNVHALAQAVAEGAGAEVRLRHVEELASELQISQSQYWGRHRSRVAEAPVATLEDLEWADGVAFGTPTRFGNVSAHLKQFVDQAGSSGRRSSWPAVKCASKTSKPLLAESAADPACPEHDRSAAHWYFRRARAHPRRERDAAARRMGGRAEGSGTEIVATLNNVR